MSSNLKRILSISLLAGLVFTGAAFFDAKSADCSLVFYVPPGSLREMHLALYDDESQAPLGEFRRYFEDKGGPQARWPMVISEGTYTLAGELITRDGKHIPVSKRVVLLDGKATRVRF